MWCWTIKYIWLLVKITFEYCWNLSDAKLSKVWTVTHILNCDHWHPYYTSLIHCDTGMISRVIKNTSFGCVRFSGNSISYVLRSQCMSWETHGRETWMGHWMSVRSCTPMCNTRLKIPESMAPKSSEIVSSVTNDETASVAVETVRSDIWVWKWCTDPFFLVLGTYLSGKLWSKRAHPALLKAESVVVTTGVTVPDMDRLFLHRICCGMEDSISDTSTHCVFLSLSLLVAAPMWNNYKYL